MGDDDSSGSSGSSSGSDASSSSEGTSSSSSSSSSMGPLGIDPLHFSVALFVLLILYVFYLMLPRAVRKQYFGSYPKRHAWSARSRNSRRSTSSSYGQSSVAGSYVGGGGSSTVGTGTGTLNGGINNNNNNNPGGGGSHHTPSLGLDEEQIDFSGGGRGQYGGNNINNLQQQQNHMAASPYGGHHSQLSSSQQTSSQVGGDTASSVLPQNDEIVISAAMQQLRDPGVLIVAHGSRGKPKTVRLQLTEAAITWRTETRKKSINPRDNSAGKPKLGKLHQVPLSHIMYVDVGKQTTALRRVENASVMEALCFSLLTKEGSLDLEANSPRERDALVSCFSLVLDEVHAQNWRDIYRGPSSDMPSSFDELDQQQQLLQQQQVQSSSQQLPGDHSSRV